MKKKRERDEMKRKNKRRKGNEDEWVSGESDDGDDDNDDDDDDEPATPVHMRSSGAKTQVAGGTATPKWAMSAKAILLDTKAVELGEEWADLISVWWELEQSTRFATSVRRFMGKKIDCDAYSII
jgi:hypothetical protein